MSDNAFFPHLFAPLQIGARTLRNRIALPATLTNYGAGHRVTERWIDFLAERAKGGAGMIVTEVIAVDPAALAHGAIVTGYEAENEDGFKRTAEAVEGAGACLVAQLWHPGRQQLWSPVRSPKGISDQPDAYSWTVPHVMTTDELRQVADEYVSVAQRLKRCGFGGVELHGAHGYLDLADPLAVVEPAHRPVRRLAGKPRALRRGGLRRDPRDLRQGFRDRPQDAGRRGREGGIDPDEAARITAALVRHGTLDYFAYSQGNFTNSLENHVPDMHFRRAHFLDIHKKVRPAAGRQARDGDRPHRDAGGGRSRDRRRRGRSRRDDARADRRRRLAEQGARGPRRTTSGRRATTISPGARSMSASRSPRSTIRSSAPRASRTGGRTAPARRSASSWWAPALRDCRRRASRRSAGTT